MFEERLKDVITDLYSGRILVVSNYGARETLFTKGITPAILLHKYYSLPITESRVVYTVKERSVRELCSLSPIDIDEYGPFKEDRVNKLIKEKLLGKSKLPKQIQKEDLSSKQHIENYLKSLNFFWFQEASRIFLYCQSLDEKNFKLSTLEQPLGVTYVIEIGPGTNIKAEYQKVKKDATDKLKTMLGINPSRGKHMPVLVILLYNAEKGGTLAEMQSYQDTLRMQENLPSGLVCLVEINGSEAKDSIDWSSYPRVIIKNDYKLQPSDPVRLIGDKEDRILKDFVSNHRQKIRYTVEERLRSLCGRYEETNTTKNKFLSFFKSNTIAGSYIPEQVESREIADTLFILGDYKRALELYKDLAQRFNQVNREGKILYNVSEMLQLSKFLHAIGNGHRSKAYESIIKYAQKYMFKKAVTLNKSKLYRYFIYIIYILHGFKLFDKDFTKSVLYLYIKKAVNEELITEGNQYPSLIPCLVHEQYANMNLLYPTPEYRRYAYDVIRVASKFSQFRLFDHHLRCLLISSYIYQGSFPQIEKYINSALSRTYLELKKYRFCIERIQQTWKALLVIYQDSSNENEEDNQFTKLYASQLRILNEVERADPQELARETDDCIPIPRISDVMVEVCDERLEEGEGVGSKWQDVGDVFLSETELTSKGMNKKNLIKMLRLFDAFTPEEKELAYRVRNLPGGVVNEAILKRNTRPCYSGEPIVVSFNMKNYLPLQLEISNIKIHLKGNRKCRINMMSPQSDKLMLRYGQKVVVSFEVVPLEEGLYEFTHISWTFFKMTSIHRFKEPQETRSAMKSLYYKLNVLEASGQLKVHMKHAPKFYEGEEAEIELVLKNKGSQPIEQLYLAIDNDNIFGFKMMKLETSVQVGEDSSLKLKIKLPILKSSDFTKCISKGIFLYKTGSTFRVQRIVTSFNIHRVAEIINLSCERISTTLHFLSFTVKYPNSECQQLDLLKSMIIHSGLEIKKVETNQLGSLTHYFFFLRKNTETFIEEYQFTVHDFPSQKVIKQTYLSSQSEQTDNDRDHTIKLFFIWWGKEGSCGVINPKPITITSTENSPSLVKLPFNAKVLLQDEIECNFREDLFAEVEVEFIIKNLFNVKEISLAVEFTEGSANDFYWQGLTEHHLSLKFNQEKTMKLKLIVLRAGLFNVARNIRYNIMINKTNSYTVHHSDYENIYLVAKEEGPVTAFQFFQEVAPSAFKKPVQSESLL